MTWAKIFKPREKKIIKIIEIPAPKPQISDANLDESIQSLAAHPGFQALNNRFKLQGAQLESMLKNRLDSTQKEDLILKLGIFWCNWLDSQVRRQVYKAPPTPAVEPLQGELAAFQEIYNTLESVGM